MAYTPKMFKEEDQADGGLAAAPKLGDSGFGLGASAAAAPGTPQAEQKDAPQSTGSVGAGTGFVNLDRVLAANQGIGAQVKQAGDAALGKEGGALKDAVKNFSNDVYRGSNYANPTQQIGNLVGGKATDEDKNAIMAALNASYSGPTSFGYKPGAGLQQAKALGNAQSTGRQLAENAQGFAGGLASYNPQLSALDRALYGQEASSVAARGQLGKDTTAFTNKFEGARDSMNAAAGAASDKADEVRNSTRDALVQAAGGITGGAQSALDAFTAGESAKWQTGGSELNPGSYNQNANRVVGTPVWEGGTDATLGNFVDPAQANTLQFISQALGDPSLAIASSGPAQAGKWAADEIPVPDFMGGPTLGVTSGSVRDNAAYQAAEAAKRKRDEENMRRATQGGFRNGRP